MARSRPGPFVVGAAPWSQVLTLLISVTCSREAPAQLRGRWPHPGQLASPLRARPCQGRGAWRSGSPREQTPQAV